MEFRYIICPRSYFEVTVFKILKRCRVARVENNSMPRIKCRIDAFGPEIRLCVRSMREKRYEVEEQLLIFQSFNLLYSTQFANTSIIFFSKHFDTAPLNTVFCQRRKTSFLRSPLCYFVLLHQPNI